MRLIIFDIDGTITRTDAIDAQAFASVVQEYLNISSLNSNWYDYRYSTDSGLLFEIFEQHAGSEPSEKDIAAIKRLFVDHLTQEFEEKPESCQPMPGISALFKTLKAHPEYEVAIATGAWQCSADLKLNHANLAHTHFPKAYAEDHYERPEIIKIALERAQTRYGVETFEQCVYVGDKLWDHDAAATLSFDFIGVGEELTHDPRTAARSLNDYTDQDQFFSLIS